MRSKYEIQEVTVINYAEIELEWTLRDHSTNDLLEDGTNTFGYYTDAYTSSFHCWEKWQCLQDDRLFVLVQVKYGKNGIVEEFIQVQELHYE